MYLEFQIIIHEQNSVLGLANRALAYLSKKIALSFIKTSNINKKNKCIHTGNPTDIQSQQIEKYTNNGNVDITIFITGGSQGAQVLDKICPEAITRFQQHYKHKVTVHHQCSKYSDPEAIKTNYQKCGNFKEIVVKTFFNDMFHELNNATIVICRAGATTITELCQTNTVAILIPYPHAKGNHQYFNAKYLIENNAGIMILQNELNEEILLNHLETIFIRNPLMLSHLSQNLKNVKIVDNEQNLMNLVLKMCKK